MKSLKFFAIVLSSMYLFACAQVEDPEMQGKNMITESGLRTHIKFLSDDLLEGRGTGTRGLELAGQYVAAQFALAGVEPGGENGTYFQEVPMVNYTATTPATFEFRKGNQRTALRYLDDFVANTGKIEPRVQVNNEIVFVGYGVDAPEQNWNDYKDMDVKGKILLMFVNDPPSDDPNHFGGAAMTYYGRWTYKNEIAGEKGAAGVILIHTEKEAGYGWNVVSSSWSGAQSTLKPKAGDPPKTALEGWITRAMGEKLFEMAGQNLDDMMQKASKRDFQPVRLGVNLVADFKSDIQDIVSQNVIGIVRGEIPDEYVIYSSHLDHLGIGIPVNNDNIYNGAVDNATGSSGLIEIAKAFAGLAKKPKRSMIFAAVTAEEQGLLGSKYYSQNPLFPVEKTLANVNFDSFTIFGKLKTITALGSDRSTLGAVVEQLAMDNGVTVTPDPEPGKGYFFRSDQFSFVKAGIPAVYIGNGDDYVDRPAGWGKEQHDKQRSTTYHAPSDEYSDSWNMDGAVQTAQLAFQLGYRIAALTTWPEWNEGDAFKAVREKSLGSD